MLIEINLNEKTKEVNFNIFIDNLQTYFFSIDSSNGSPLIFLFNNEDSMARLSISQQFSLFKAKYKIRLSDNNEIEFKTKSTWKLHYQCQKGVDTFDIYGHIGRKYSVYKNNVQIAYWDKNGDILRNGVKYSIISDNHCEFELVIAFCLIIDNFLVFDAEQRRGMVFNFGNVGGQEKEFNADWKPNDRK